MSAHRWSGWPASTFPGFPIFPSSDRFSSPTTSSSTGPSPWSRRLAWFLNKSRAGLILRAVGDSHDAAHAIGYPVIRIRYLAVIFGGVMAGLGGAYLSLAYTPMWIEQMTAGRGWIALALVVFAAWRPLRVLIGAYLFGGVTILQLHAQGGSLIDIPSQYLSMLPYIATIIVLTLMSSGAARRRLQAPACLGRPFHPTA